MNQYTIVNVGAYKQPLMRPSSGCPKGTVEGITTCFCEDHCSWEVCRLDRPPYRCLPRINTAWVWDSEKLFWTAQETGTS